MLSVDSVRALPGKGLEGDRYFLQTGTYSSHPKGDRQITLIEKEAVEALSTEEGIGLDPKEARRNVITAGVALNHLVGRKFKVGEVTLRGIRLCEPCTHLEGLTKPGVRQGLVHRGGLRAEILTEGVMRVGDSVNPMES